VSTFVLTIVSMVTLLGLIRLLVGLTPVTLTVDGDSETLQVGAEGTVRTVARSRPIVAVRPARPTEYRREHQIDGSDSTNMLLFDPAYFATFGKSWYYRFQALLREEWRYSVWTNLEVEDGSGRLILQVPNPSDEDAFFVPARFHLTIQMERPEIPRSLELIDDQGQTVVVEINRNDKKIRVGPRRSQDGPDLTSWYFPREAAAPLATLIDLLTRSVVLGLGLLLVVAGAAAVVPALVTWLPGRRTLVVAIWAGLAIFLAACGYVATALFDQAPHILDAIAYTFQAKMFASGTVTAPPPPLREAFQVPFSTVYEGRWIIQYPPGTAFVLALGMLVHLAWLVEPLMAAGAIALIVLAANRQYGPGTALIVLALLVSSPFMLLMAGSFMSHAPALFFASVALYAATRYAERPSVRWAATIAAGLGLGLLTREIVSVLYGLTLILAGLATGSQMRGRRIVLDFLVMATIGGAAVALYLAYNAAVTGDPFLLPRLVVDGRDRFGFGTGIGFYNEHTVAAGLVNIEEQLISLGFLLAGWPFGFSLAVLLLPFLTWRLKSWDLPYGALVLLYLLIYSTYYYHGIVFGPRYLFEALPALVILTARGFVGLTEHVGGWLGALGFSDGWWRARQATAVVALALFACNLGYFLPRQATMYANYPGALLNNVVLDDGVVARDLAGRTSRLANALVVVDEWWWYMSYFAALNCPTLDCPTLFALGSDPEMRAKLRQAFPDRVWYDVVRRDGRLTIVPGTP
jgi:hypothetical protein